MMLHEAMENFVFPDDIKTKLMSMSKLKNIFTSLKIMGKHSKLHFFPQKHQWNVQLFHSQNVFLIIQIFLIYLGKGKVS